MKIVLSTLNSKYIHSSLALRYLKAFSQKEFPDIFIAEYSINEPILHIVSDIYQKKPDVIGFSCYIWNIEQTISAVELIKKVMPEVIIVLGGPEVSYDLDYWFKRVKEIDFIVSGEGEITFHELLKAIEANNDFSDVPGLAYRDKDKYRINKPRIKVKLDEIPSPYLDPEDINSLKDKVVYYEASRGCPFSCAYCLSSIETGVRYFSIERVKEDLLRLINHNVKTIKFIDRTFNTNKKYALEIFKFLIENHRSTVFQFEITADIMKADVLQFLVDNAPEGIFRFEIGVQSTNEFTNSLVNRKQNFEKLSYTVLKLQETSKIDQHVDLIAGLPHEDYDSFRKSFNDVFALKPRELQLGFLKMLRGTQIWREADKYSYKYMDKAPYEFLENEIMPFSDVIRIKRVEDVLEKYWNAHRMDLTLEFLIINEFNSAFDFFQEFGDYWEGKGWNRIGHQVETLFERLNEFLHCRKTKNLEFILSLMKLDYFLNHKHKPRKTWWDYQLSKNSQNQYFKVLVEHPELVSANFSELELNEREIHKHIMLEVIPFNLQAYLQSGDIKKEKTLMIIYYNFPDIPLYFFKIEPNPL